MVNISAQIDQPSLQKLVDVINQLTSIFGIEKVGYIHFRDCGVNLNQAKQMKKPNEVIEVMLQRKAPIHYHQYCRACPDVGLFFNFLKPFLECRPNQVL